LDAAQSQNMQSDTRSAALARQCSALEIQLTEAQHAVQNDAQHEAELQSQLRTVESNAAEVREQLDEQTNLVQQQEAKIQAQNVQVGFSCCTACISKNCCLCLFGILILTLFILLSCHIRTMNLYVVLIDYQTLYDRAMSGNQLYVSALF